MRIEIVPFEPAMLSRVVRFAERTWRRQESDAFYKWRFAECPADMLLAIRGDECLAMLCAFRRTYKVRGADATYAETFDWYSLPEYRNAGLGVVLLREMMHRPEPMIVVGGSRDTMTLLPRLGWRDLTDAELFVLPLSGAAISGQVRKAYGVPQALTERAFDVSAKFWFRPRPAQPAAGYAAHAMDAVDEDVLSLYRDDHSYGLVPVPDLARLRWLTSGMPDTSRFVATYFTCDGTLVGWSLAKVWWSNATREASLLECYTPNPDAGRYSWMVGETARRLSALGPVKILARATCPMLRGALRRNRFLSRGTVPVRVWNVSGALPGPAHLTYNVGDADMLPYPGDGQPS